MSTSKTALFALATLFLAQVAQAGAKIIARGKSADGAFEIRALQVGQKDEYGVSLCAPGAPDSSCSSLGRFSHEEINRVLAHAQQTDLTQAFLIAQMKRQPYFTSIRGHALLGGSSKQILYRDSSAEIRALRLAENQYKLLLCQQKAANETCITLGARAYSFDEISAAQIQLNLNGTRSRGTGHLISLLPVGLAFVKGAARGGGVALSGLLASTMPGVGYEFFNPSEISDRTRNLNAQLYYEGHNVLAVATGTHKIIRDPVTPSTSEVAMRIDQALVELPAAPAR